MKSAVQTKKLLEIYYDGFARKQDWEMVLSDDFRFMRCDMNPSGPMIGKQAYIEVINRFSKVFETMRVKEMLIDGENACVIGNYDFKFPNGVYKNGDVAELWKIKDGKLASLTIFFDTHTFVENTPKQRADGIQ